MVIWKFIDDSSGAPQPAFQIYPYGVDRPLEAYVAQCVSIKVLSFNMGMPQSIRLESDRRWSRQHVAGARPRAVKVRDVLPKLGQAADDDFVICSEVGDMRKGFRASILDFGYAVQEGLPEASYFTDGAYLNLWNVPTNIAAEVQSGTWTAWMDHGRMPWQAFELTYDAPRFAARDAPQLAALKVGFLVGNINISAQHCLPKQRILTQALQHLTNLEVDAWRNREDFQVMRLLVGDCNLTKEQAEAVTQKIRLPPLTPLQRDFNFCRWEVCDVEFPRQVLEFARRQYTNHIHTKYRKLKKETTNTKKDDNI